MNVPLNPQQEALIKRKIESGLYRSPEEVIDTALRLLDERDRKLAALRKDIEEGLASGPGRQFDESVVQDIKRRGRERLAERQAPE
ncbi:MAG TPA: type II toxin-antitoxin system ParD family antitoxin [Dehalococcoidia bacterium]|nr:type II toxin-antitoxin system ParD family antitoxin [Dehalococcoidia bacterium]